MLKSIQSRLFASYVFVLLLTLILVAGVTVTTISRSTAPPEVTWYRLELLLTAYTSPGTARNFIQGFLNNDTDNDVLELLDTFADANDVRMMLVTQNGNAYRVIHDTDSIFTGDNAPQFDISDHTPQRARLAPPNEQRDDDRGSRDDTGITPLPIMDDMIFGTFTDDDTGGEWLFAASVRESSRRLSRFDNILVVIAEPDQNVRLAAEIGNLREVFWQPLFRSAVIAGVVAFLFAILLGRNITRPLSALAAAAKHIADGKYTDDVPETGPAEIKQVASAFNHMTNEVRATQQSQRDFMANVSHDLKTPLTSIQGFSQAIMDGAARNPQEAAKIIYDEATRLDRMVAELTDLARLQAGRLSMKMTALDMSALVKAIGDRLQVVAQKKHITLDVQTSNVPSISGDGDRLVQVMTNLIGNAIKYTPEGGNVWVTLGIQRGGVQVVVRDDGIGIPQEDLPRIFDRFYQVDKSRGPSRGTGLGLAITREIVHGHGGEITIDSAGRGQGTTVTVWLPSPKLSTIVSRRVTDVE